MTRLRARACSFLSPRGKLARAQCLLITRTVLACRRGSLSQVSIGQAVRLRIEDGRRESVKLGSEFVKERVRRAFSFSGKAGGRRSWRDLSHPPSLKRLSELEKKVGNAQARPERD